MMQNRLNATHTLAALAIGSGTSLASDPEYTLVNTLANINAITTPVSTYTGQHDRMAGGVSVGDFNNDTYPDIFLPGLGTVPDMLFINQQDGTFSDEAALWGIDRLEHGVGSAVGDVNNDWLPDIYYISYGPSDQQAQPGKCILYINQGPDKNGQWSFRDEAQQRGVNEILDIVAGKGACFGDYDLDGDLDLYTATWQFTTEDAGNRLYENDGTGHFTDVSAEVLPPDQPVLRGFTPKMVDLNGDRYPELLLTCDFETSALYISNGPGKNGRVTFRDETDRAGITTDHNGMGATVNDFNGDGELDWFMTNIYVPSASYFNTLYMGAGVEGDGTPIFIDQATTRGVQDNGWGWGVTSADVDNDGDIDIVATNGWPQWPNEPTRMWRNDGTGIFNDISFISGLSFNINGRGLVHLDYDLDGDLDLAFVDNGGPFRLYRNDLGFPGRPFTHYLRYDINTDAHPCLAPMGYGTRIIATYNGSEHLRVIDGASTYLGQSELTVHFGLAHTESVDSVRFEWADGTTTTIENPEIDRQHTIHAHHPADMDRDGRFTFYDVSRFLTSYIAQDDQSDFNNDGAINVMDVMDFIKRYNTPCP